MNTKILLSKKRVIALSFFITFAFTGMLYAASIFDIEYPIPELGNCANGAECKAYCAIDDHEAACDDFAAQYGIGNAAEHKQKMENIMEDGGPGNCAAGAIDPEASCKMYCDSQAHIRECVAYGKEHNLLEGEELAEAEKVIKALDAGAKLPAGCTNKDSCRETCEDPKDIDTAKQCFLFAEQAGLLPPGVDRDKAEKTFQLIAEGRAPFKSIKDFKQCDNPASDEILQKCISFASENGLMSSEEAEIVKKTGGKGPGGCVGKMQCKSYCEIHQEECFQFAQENNLMRPEDKARMREGIDRLKQGLENAPPKVKQCISQGVGDDILNQILSGQKPPSPQIGTVMRSCFESAFAGGRPMENSSSTMGYPGDEGFGLPTAPRRRHGGFPAQGGFPGQDGGQDMGMPAYRPSGAGGSPQANFSPEVEACIVAKAGEEGLNKIKNPSDRPDQTLGAVISGCFRQIEGPRTGPGGCTTAEECKKFCSDPANAETCQISTESSMGGGMEGNMPAQSSPPEGTAAPDFYRNMMPGGIVPGGEYPGQYPGAYPMPPTLDGQYTPGQYPMPPQGEPGGVYPSPYVNPIEPPPPPPTSFLLGVKNFASVIFSFFNKH